MSQGDFVVVWQDDNDENGVWEVFARGFAANARTLFNDIVVNTNSTGNQLAPAVAAYKDGFAAA